MKRGRPSDEYPAEEFRQRAAERMTALNLTLRQVEERSGVNRGTVSQILRGRRPCAADDRHALMVALGFDATEHRHFLAGRADQPPELIFYDGSLPYSGDYLPIQRGRELLMHSMFPEARRQLIDAYNGAIGRKDFVRAADAAEVMAWLELEVMERDNLRALAWANNSIALIEKHVGLSVDQILHSLEAGGHSAEITTNDEATAILSKVLHIRSKVFAERVVYYADTRQHRCATDAFQRSLALDGYRQTAGQFGHDFR